MNEKSIIVFLFNLVSRRRGDLQEARSRTGLGLGPLVRQTVPDDVEEHSLEKAQQYLASVLQRGLCGALVETGQPARVCARPEHHEGSCADADDVERYPALYSVGPDGFIADPQPDYEIRRAERSDWSPYDPSATFEEDTYWVALGPDVISARFVIVDEDVGCWVYDDGGDPCVEEIDMEYATHVMHRAVPAPPQHA